MPLSCIMSVLNNQAVTEKLKKYCAYRERCEQEVRQKLRQEHVGEKEADKVIALLVKEDFLNEERYARAFARGKFNINKWGRRKIEAALIQQNIPEKHIRKGLSEINENDYRSVLSQLLKKTAQGKLSEQERRRVVSRMAAKGFEPELIWQQLKTAGFL